MESDYMDERVAEFLRKVSDGSLRIKIIAQGPVGVGSTTLVRIPKEVDADAEPRS